MKSIDIPVQSSNLFNRLTLDYLLERAELKEFVFGFPDEQTILKFVDECKFDYLNREILVNELLRQNEVIQMESAVQSNINALREENVFTITTGHQLCLFTGPAYFFYKIISVIQLAKKLNGKNTGKRFVPVFWMASEDHDREEMDHTFLFGKKIQWETSQKGKVGEFKLQGLDKTLDSFLALLGDTDTSRYVHEIFQKGLDFSGNLSEFTRSFLNQLFGKYGLVIIDGNSLKLKSQFKKELKRELFERKGWSCINQTIEKLTALNYPIQVNPREINLFYAENGLRERIVLEDSEYKILNTSIQFSKSEMETLVDQHPEKLSPNVVLRPLYQQCVLPNAVYCGGPAEIAYWLQLKNYFDQSSVHFPVLIPRNSICILDENIFSRWQKLGFDIQDFFKNEEELKKDWLRRQEAEISLNDYRQKTETMFSDLKLFTGTFDSTLVPAVDSEKQKLLNTISTIEKKINRSLKLKHETTLGQIGKLKSKVFPEGIFQERRENFFAIINKYGVNLIEELIETENPGLTEMSFKLM